MILANEVVARHLESRDIPSIYRVHEEPDPAKVEIFAEIVATFGLQVSSQTRAARRVPEIYFFD